MPVRVILDEFANVALPDDFERILSTCRSREISSNTNYQNAGRELLMPDEVRMLSNRKALVFIRGERPVMDDKYPIQKHCNFHRTADGGKKPY